MALKTCCLNASSVGGSIATVLSVVVAMEYLSSSSVLQFVLFRPYNSSTNARALEIDVIVDDVTPNSESL